MDKGIAGFVCPLCGRQGYHAGVRDGCILRICDGGDEDGRHAPILLSWQWSSEEEYEAWYRDDDCYHVTEAEAVGVMPTLQLDATHTRSSMHRARILTALQPYTQNLLDIGAGTGAFVVMMTAHGVGAKGWEMNRNVVAEANKIGRNLECGSWKDAVKCHQADKDTFMAITMHDVFEHLTRPEECLTQLKSILDPGGLLVIEMPEWECPQAKKAGMRWKHVKPRQHLCLYSDRAAQELFERAGYEVVAAIRPIGGQLGKISYYLRKVIGG